MTGTIKKLIESTGAIVCPDCKGEGEYDAFCGHYFSETCCMCQGAGVVKSLKKIKFRKKCIVCGGKGCLGGCNYRGYHEWEAFEPFLEKRLIKQK